MWITVQCILWSIFSAINSNGEHLYSDFHTYSCSLLLPWKTKNHTHNIRFYLSLNLLIWLYKNGFLKFVNNCFVFLQCYCPFSIFLEDFKISLLIRRAITQKPEEGGMKLFLYINEQVEDKNSQENNLTESARFFVMPVWLSDNFDLLIIAARTLELINNITYLMI